MDRQIGLEQTPGDYVAQLVEVFRKVWRALADTGTLWLNLGDSFCTVPHGPKQYNADDRKRNGISFQGVCANRQELPGLKHKDLIGIPWRVAFALQADGWTLRSDIVWAKLNPMPESVTDRPTRAHEYIFLLSKQAKYHYDADAIREKARFVSPATWGRVREAAPGDGRVNQKGAHPAIYTEDATRNRRSVWTVASKPYKNAHFATFPPRLIEPCILAGCPAGGTVLDPFAGTATAGMVAIQHGRKFVGIDLNAKYLDLAQRRLSGVQMGLPFTSDEEE